MANAGYLFDVRVESLAPASLCTRILAHRDEIGLTAVQVGRLLDLNRIYHERQTTVLLEFIEIKERLEIKGGRVGAETLPVREELLDRHAELFRRHEALFFEFSSRCHDVLSDDQIAVAEGVYYAELQETIVRLQPTLARALAAAPARQVASASGPASAGG